MEFDIGLIIIKYLLFWGFYIFLFFITLSVTYCMSNLNSSGCCGAPRVNSLYITRSLAPDNEAPAQDISYHLS